MVLRVDSMFLQLKLYILLLVLSALESGHWGRAFTFDF